MEAQSVLKSNQDTLRDEYSRASIALGSVCSKFLKIGWNLCLENMVIEHDSASAEYDGKLTKINFKHYREPSTHQLILRFYSDDIPALHMPIDLRVTDGSVVNMAYRTMIIAHDNWKYENM